MFIKSLFFLILLITLAISLNSDLSRKRHRQLDPATKECYANTSEFDTTCNHCINIFEKCCENKNCLMGLCRNSDGTRKCLI